MKNSKLWFIILLLLVGLFWIFFGSKQKLETDTAKSISNQSRLLNVASTALDYYMIDYHAYPMPIGTRLPISIATLGYVKKAYVSSSGKQLAEKNGNELPIDIFATLGYQTVELWGNAKGGNTKTFKGDMLKYYLLDDDFVVVSVGPDGKEDIDPHRFTVDAESELVNSSYDVTNGIISRGDFFTRSHLTYMTTETLLYGFRNQRKK